jgi:hypothetical protein
MARSAKNQCEKIRNHGRGCRDADYARPLTEDEQLERDTLIAENPFKDWMRRDFNAFIRSCEKHGRENLTAVAREVDSKSEDEVRAYAATFFKRYTELQDYERYMKQIERGEQKIQRQQDIMKVRRLFCASFSYHLEARWGEAGSRIPLR